MFLEHSVPQMCPGTNFELHHLGLFPNQVGLVSWLHEFLQQEFEGLVRPEGHTLILITPFLPPICKCGSNITRPTELLWMKLCRISSCSMAFLCHAFPLVDSSCCQPRGDHVCREWDASPPWHWFRDRDKREEKNTNWAHGLMAAILVSWGHCQLPLSQSSPQALLGFMMNNLGFPGAEPGCIGFVW